jgi:uncharacterized membrane protein
MTKRRAKSPTLDAGAPTDAPAPTLNVPERPVLLGLLGFRPSLAFERVPVSAENAVTRGLAVAKTYTFASVDYPGAAHSMVFDSDGVTEVGVFDFDPGSTTSRPTAFTFTGGVYRIFTVPNSNTSSATGINAENVIVGMYQDLAGKRRGFEKRGATFSDIDYPGAIWTQANGINDAGEIVGSFLDSSGGSEVEHGFRYSSGTFTAIDFPGGKATAAAGINAAGDVVGVWLGLTALHGFMLRAGAFTPIDFPLARKTTAWGINDAGEIAGDYSDDANKNHGFLFADGAFSTVDVAGARHTALTRIKNGGQVTGVYLDAVTGQHGHIGR